MFLFHTVLDYFKIVLPDYSPNVISASDKTLNTRVMVKMDGK